MNKENKDPWQKLQPRAILLKPVTEESLKRLKGRLKDKGVLKSLLEERRKDAQRE